MKDILELYERALIWFIVFMTGLYFYFVIYGESQNGHDEVVMLGSIQFDSSDYMTFSFIIGLMVVELVERLVARMKIDYWEYESLKKFGVKGILFNSSIILVVLSIIVVILQNADHNPNLEVISGFLLISVVSNVIRHRFYISDDYLIINNKQVQINEETTLVDTDYKDITLRTDGELYVVKVNNKSVIIQLLERFPSETENV